MKKTILILLFLVHGVVQAQMSDSLLNYYSYANAAEIAICDNNYDEALKLYDTAFTYKTHPYGIDIYNIGVIYLLKGEYEKVHFQFKKIINMGCPISYFQEREDPVFHDFFQTKFGKKLIKDAEHPKITYNVQLRNIYDSLVVADQFFRKKEGSYKIHGDTIYKIDVSNVKKVNELIKKHGFPNEQQIGIHSGFGYNPISLIIVHHNLKSGKKEYFDWTETLLKAIYSGNINVRSGAPLIERNEGKSIFGIQMYGGLKYYLIQETTSTASKIPDKVTWGYFPIKGERKEEVKPLDKEREKIGLNSIAESRKVSATSIQTPFHFNSGELWGYTVTKENYERRMKTFIKVYTEPDY